MTYYTDKMKITKSNFLLLNICVFGDTFSNIVKISDGGVLPLLCIHEFDQSPIF